MKLDVCEFIRTEPMTDEDGFPIQKETSCGTYACEEVNIKTSLKLQGVREGTKIEAILLVNRDDYEEAGSPRHIIFNGNKYRVFNTQNKPGRNKELVLIEEA